MLPESLWLVKLRATAFELEYLHCLNLQPQDEMSHRGAGTSLLLFFWLDSCLLPLPVYIRVSLSCLTQTEPSPQGDARRQKM